MTGQTARYVKAGRVDEVPVGRAGLFEVEDRHVAVYRLGEGFHAIDDLCTHDGGPLGDGEVEGDEVICPRHGARFNIKTGAAVALPAVAPVESYPVRVDGEDLYIGLPD